MPDRGYSPLIAYYIFSYTLLSRGQLVLLATNKLRRERRTFKSCVGKRQGKTVKNRDKFCDYPGNGYRTSGTLSWTISVEPSLLPSKFMKEGDLSPSQKGAVLHLLDAMSLPLSPAFLVNYGALLKFIKKLCSLMLAWMTNFRHYVRNSSDGRLL